MKIALIGAGSRTGRHVLAQAPKRGHEVVAFTRDAAALHAHASAPRASASGGSVPGGPTSGGPTSAPNGPTSVTSASGGSGLSGSAPGGSVPGASASRGSGQDPRTFGESARIKDLSDDTFPEKAQILASDAPGHVAKITVVEGDGRDIDAVKRAVAGADAVISIVAAGSRKGPHVTAEVARVVIEAMRECGVRRLVFTSAYPIVAERPKLAIALLRRVFAGSYADAAEMERLVSASDLDWTIVRLNRLLDRPATGTAHYQTGLLERPGALSRADAASVLLDVVADPALSKTAVNVSG